MKYIIDRTPLPPVAEVSLRAKLAELEIGQSLLAVDGNLNSLRVTCSRIKREIRGCADRQFKTMDTPEGPRAWRLA